MTCIVGFTDGKNVWIGGDSAGVAGQNLMVRSDEKVFKNGPMVFGFTSSFRMGQLLRYALKIPDHDPRKDDYAYMCTDFVDAVIACMKTGGYARIESNEIMGGCFLVGYKGKLYQVESDFQVGARADMYNACGCGQSYALGVMRSMCSRADNITDPERMIIEALETAAYFSSSVVGPFHIVNTLNTTEVINAD